MFLGIAWVEWFGYAASLAVVVSLTMSSLVKLRTFNLIGAGMFSAYGFLIGALPVGLLNLAIVFINLAYLARMYREKDEFRIMRLESGGDNDYLRYFLDCHARDIERFFPHFDDKPALFEAEGRNAFYLLKNSVPIGVLIGRREADGSFTIELDYVGPRFRDFKMGSFIYRKNDFFREQGYSQLKAPVGGGKHDTYLQRMGFSRQGDFFVKAV